MLAISVEFLHGIFRGDPSGAAITGGLTLGEWPPSPARLFAALVAADGTRQRSRVTDGRELLWLEKLPPPTIHSQSKPHHQKLKERYVVKQHGGAKFVKKKGESQRIKTHHEYICREGALHRSGVRVTLGNPLVVYRWNVEPPDGGVILSSLKRRAARVGYLGTSDSPCRIRVVSKMPDDAPKESIVPDSAGDTPVSVPKQGDVEVLDRMYDAWVDGGPSVNRSQFPSLFKQTKYRSPMAAPEPDRGSVVVWLRLRQAVSGRRISAVTALFKAAVLKRYQEIHGDPPNILHGHGFTGAGYDLARYLALPDVGCRHSRGRIHGLALWLPPGADRVQCQKVREAAIAIDALVGQGIKSVVEPGGAEERPWAANPCRWQEPSSIWVTAFPVIHERRGVPGLSEVARWFSNAGLPEPIAFRSSRTPLLPGGVDLAPVEVNRPGYPALPYSHAEFRFASPVAGPVIIGAGRQRGFGLCLPVDG